MYSNVNGFRVIAADNRDPAASWASHRSRRPASLGGVDCVAPIGTPIYAPDDCFVTRIPNNGSGGNTLRMAFGDGWVDEFMHFSRFGDGSVGDTKKGELVGFSGDSGAPGQPHVHWHRIGAWYRDEWGSTNRYNPWNFFGSTPAGAGGSTPAGADGTPNIDRLEDDMPFILSSAGGQDLVVDGHVIPFATPEEVGQTTGAPVVGVPKVMHHRIRAALAKSQALPLIVYVPEGNGTIYTLSGGRLTALTDVRTVAELADRGAASISISVRERDNLLSQA
ncbi:M23 family metallopeptidase [Agromyces ramosus]|uniref:M23ase beta-sheet core domain-containing protein n=1 Tax=Agromyces ramosus TaxID=33879 RepID=A0ABU0R8M6_9MICO|nr:M23 family metallopeptidase [Agromyces ramosus]MDQ0894419.1 hypothetical protein [Agromyces ramosus]